MHQNANHALHRAKHLHETQLLQSWIGNQKILDLYPILLLNADCLPYLDHRREFIFYTTCNGQLLESFNQRSDVI